MNRGWVRAADGHEWIDKPRRRLGRGESMSETVAPDQVVAKEIKELDRAVIRFAGAWPARASSVRRPLPAGWWRGR
jgi:hypothetical protein